MGRLSSSHSKMQRNWEWPTGTSAQKRRHDETVSKFGVKFESCHHLGSHSFRFPHPNPLPKGEGATYSRWTIPSPLGRGTQGEGIRATKSTSLRVLRQARCLSHEDECISPLTTNWCHSLLTAVSILIPYFSIFAKRVGLDRPRTFAAWDRFPPVRLSASVIIRPASRSITSPNVLSASAPERARRTHWRMAWSSRAGPSPLAALSPLMA